MNDSELEANIDIQVQEILLAASQHDLTTLQHLLRSYSFPECESVDVQDSETGFTPLHAAIAACEAEDEQPKTIFTASSDADHSAQTNNRVLEIEDGESEKKELMLRATETVRCLLQNGAIWNQLDKNDETAGCVANRLGLRELYELMVDAGVRAELLLNRLEGYEKLQESDDDIEDIRDGEVNGANHSPAESMQWQEPLRADAEISSTHYLSSTLSLGADKILDEQSNGVMMSWESGIMLKSATALLTAPNMNVLNVGFGMGIIDGHFQSHSNKPASHHIIEAHPTVLADMKAKSWYDKPGVVIHEGKWQDILPKLVLEGHMFDAIYFDTFAESYSEFRDFFSEQVIGLLEPSGKFSFFNGLGADRQISYDVYQKVVEMELFEAGFDIEWEEFEVPKLDHEWEGVKRKYWKIERYRLPICMFME